MQPCRDVHSLNTVLRVEFLRVALRDMGPSCDVDVRRAIEREILSLVDALMWQV